MLRSPELDSLSCRDQLIRIPDEVDVPITDRVRRLIDTKAFRRLASIPQLGLVALVYPGAQHSRFEHSLGVYRNALAFVERLQRDPRFAPAIGEEGVSRLLVAALLHDLGHWPFCHPIEDLGLSGVGSHEAFAAEWLHDREITAALREDWDLEPAQVLQLLDGPHLSRGDRIAASVLSGPIDVDKLDYLYRDSLHAGVPYGRNFDRNRLIAGLCLDEAGERLAIDDKAKTAAEMMVFARYVMFSEVYWHHAVRAATAMFQRLFFEVHRARNLQEANPDWNAWFREDPRGFLQRIHPLVQQTTAADLFDGLFGARRRLFKRLAQFGLAEGTEVYSLIARRPYEWLVRCSAELSQRISAQTGHRLAPGQVLIDAPPVGLEVQFKVDVRDSQRLTYRTLGSVSPVVETLATRQFDDFVKRVRVFVAPDHADAIRNRLGNDPSAIVELLLLDAARATESL